jgi:pSer/pThr/pTyr-binding forkhead associated (FHA) protein
VSDDPLAVALQFGFLVVLYLFLLWVVRSARRDLVRGQEPAAVEQDLDEPRAEIDISEGVTLGRAGSADIHVEDPFASSVHARIFARNGFMYVEDMGSTNGTYLNGRQLRKAEQLKPADKIRIGDSEYSYRE